MRAVIILSTVLLIGVTYQMPQSAEPTFTTTDNPIGAKNVTVNCTTTKKLKGVCTERIQCDYGPNGIDFTLYMPSWYKNVCTSKEVCCPFEYVLMRNESQVSKGDDKSENIDN